jgi:hypothetical protein
VTTGLRNHPSHDELDEHRLGKVEREVRCGLAEDAAHHHRDEAADDEEARDREERAAPPQV